MTIDTALRWTERALGRRVIRFEPLVGSTTSGLFRVIPDEGPATVLRVFTNEEWLEQEPDLAEREAAALAVVASSIVPTPLLIAFDVTGDEAGIPALLMSQVPGSVVVRSPDRDAWLDGLAATLATLHEIELAEFAWSYRVWQDLDAVSVPAWAGDRDLWTRTINRVRDMSLPASSSSFIHRDFHPANVLWSAGAVSGVVDWVNACLGPREVDVAHCRLNLTVMYGLETADGFTGRYESATERTFDPLWDLMTAVEWLPEAEVYPPWQAWGLADLNTPTVRKRLEHFAASALARLG